MLLNIGITGVGGSAGIVCIKALKTSGYRLFGFDCNPLSAGFKLVDKAIVIPKAHSPVFFDVLKHVCEENEIDVLIPTVDEELYVIAERKAELPCIAVLSSKETLRKCLDKRRLIEYLGKNTPRTFYPAFKIKKGNYPVVVKPAIGRGSRHIYVCQDKQDLNWAIKKCPKPILIQEFLSEPEYSVDTLSDLKGKCLASIPRERIEVKGGVVWRGKIVFNKKIEKLAKWAVEKLAIKGPAVVQIREGKILEINPRVGGSTILSVKAGVNIPELAVKIFMGKKVNIPKPKEISMARYFEEAYFEGSLCRGSSR